MKVSLNFKGFGVSIIDEQPRELLFLSVYNLNLQLSRWIETRSDGSGVLETVTKLKFSLEHL